MNYTENYHLPQWDETDRIMREDFNQMCADIDGGISGALETAQDAKTEALKLPYVIGTYTGDGDTDHRHIALGFRPSFIIISGQGEGYNGDTGADRFYIATSGNAFSYMFGMTDDGVWVTHYINHFPNLNYPGLTYDYIAFR